MFKNLFRKVFMSGKYIDQYGQITKEGWFRVVKFSITGLVLLIVLFGSFGTVGAGERGVKTRFGAVASEPLNEGLYIKIPIIEAVKKIDVKIQKTEVPANAASKDLQIVTSQVALNFHIDPEQTARLYQEVGKDYEGRIIAPALQEAVKATTAKYTAEELITQRELVKEDIKQYLKNKIEPRGIAVDEFNIVNFDFSGAFNEAIENKVTAEQNALAAKNKLQQIEFEAQQDVARAKGKAEAIQIEADALRSNPEVLQLRAVEKWNGVLPQVTGQATPFVNIK